MAKPTNHYTEMRDAMTIREEREAQDDNFELDEDFEEESEED